jgi:predicted GIY-YIG superfamily endonuclease
MGAWVYILRLKSRGLYVGVTINLAKRVNEHMSGCGCRTTHLDPPVELVYQEWFPSLEQAKAREYQLKHWTRAKKEALIAGNIAQVHRLAIRRHY